MMKTVAKLTGDRHPILFSKPMIHAMLEGHKTQTRRIVRDVSKAASPRRLATAKTILDRVHCPYGKPGHLLWVRETFGIVTGNGSRVVYRADGDPPPPVLGTSEKNGVREMKWTPSIFMRATQSRITLEVTAVRVERLNEITEDDARAEGVEGYTLETWSGYDPKTDSYPEFFAAPEPKDGIKNVRHHVRVTSARTRYEQLWNQINGARAHWSSNPFVWVIEFKRAA